MLKSKHQKGVFQPSERWRLEYYSRLFPRLSEIVSGSPNDYDDPNDPIGLDFHRTTEA